MSEDWLWRDDGSGLALRPAADEAESAVELWHEETVVAALDEAAALSLAQALSGWAQPTFTPPAGDVWFQVYYVPEYHDDGQLLLPEGLGEPNESGAYVFDEADLDGVRARARALGAALADLHEAITGQAYGENVDEKARAWLSVFRMPDDVRTWKGFWEDLDDLHDDELSGS